jgi:hypothetical protein
LAYLESACIFPFRLLALPFDLLAIELKIHTHVRFSSHAGI